MQRCSTDIVTLTLQSVRNQNQLWEAAGATSPPPVKVLLKFPLPPAHNVCVPTLGISLQFCPCGRERVVRNSARERFIYLCSKREREEFSVWGLFCGTARAMGAPVLNLNYVTWLWKLSPRLSHYLKLHESRAAFPNRRWSAAEPLFAFPRSN